MSSNHITLFKCHHSNLGLKLLNLNIGIVDQECLSGTVGFETVMACCVNSGFLGDCGPSIHSVSLASFLTSLPFFLV